MISIEIPAYPHTQSDQQKAWKKVKMKRKTKQARPKEAQQQLRVVALRNRRMANCKLRAGQKAESNPIY